MTNASVTVWDTKAEEIYNLFGRPLDLTKSEFELFCQMGKSLDLNPFLGEIQATKFKGKTKIFIGRDGYRKNAVKHPNYEGHFVDSIRENDKFAVKGAIPQHTYASGDRGALVGAYCITYVKGNKIPIFVRVAFNEYNRATLPGERKSNGDPKKPNTWNEIPETMIKKVAEAQGLRMAFPEKFQGTYDASEDWTGSDLSKNKPKPKGQEIQQASYQMQDDAADPDNKAAIGYAREAGGEIIAIMPQVYNTLQDYDQALFTPYYAGQTPEDVVSLEVMDETPPPGTQQEQPKNNQEQPPASDQTHKTPEPAKAENAAPLPAREMTESARNDWIGRIYDMIANNETKFGQDEAMMIIDKIQDPKTTDGELLKIERTVLQRVCDLAVMQKDLRKALGFMSKVWAADHIRHSLKKHLGSDIPESVTDVVKLYYYIEHLRSEFKKAMAEKANQ